MKLSILLLITGIVSSHIPVNAQDQIQFSLFPGYHVINSDQPTPEDNKTNWIFGGNVSLSTEYKGYPIELSVGYSEGNSRVHKLVASIDIPNPPTYGVNLLYRTLPIEAYRKFQLGKRFKVLAGLNLTFQHRILQYDERFSIGNDRLFSIGLGLSSKIQTNLFTFNSGNGAIFGNLAVRWTEFIFHDANGRDLDDFTLRHVAISPQIGIAWSLK